MVRKSGIAVIIAVVAISVVAVASMGFSGADVNVYKDEHVDVSKTSDFLGRTILKATVSEGYYFDGWYDENGKLLSDKTVYEGYFENGQIIYASSMEYVKTECGGTVDLSTYMTIPDTSNLTVSASDYDGSTPVVKGTKVTTANPGTYKSVYFDKNEHVRSVVAIMTDGIIQKTYEWTYNTSSLPTFNINPFKPASKSGEYKLTIGILYSDYVHYTTLYKDGEYARWGKITNTDVTTEDITHDVAYVHYDTVQDKYIDKICDYIRSMTEGKNEQYVANVILAFTQAIEYKSDEDVHGEDEYWQFPLETLFLSSGDCEDSSILFCAIAERMGYETSYFLYSGHMSAGVALENFSAPTRTSESIHSGSYGWYLETGTDASGEKVEKAFYCCETTNSGWLVGEIPESEYEDYKFGVPIDRYLSSTSA